MIHHPQQLKQHRRQQTPTRAKRLPVWVAVGSMAMGMAGWAIGPGDAFVPPLPTPFRSHPRGTELASQSQSPSPSASSSDADLLQDLPFVPKEVMGKFMAAVGDPLTAASLEQGYQAGVVSQDELKEIQTRMPGIMPESNNNNNDNRLQIQSVQTIEAHWMAALEGQPWHVQSMCKLATSTLVPLVAKLQEKAVRQATAMKWINEHALPLLQRNTTLVGLLLQPDSAFFETSPTTQLAFNNTRAKYETDRGVWSASMDVFVKGGSRTSSRSSGTDASSEAPSKTDEDPDPEQSEASAALQALTDGLDEDEISSFVGSVAVLEKDSAPKPSVADDDDKTVGLVNAYFVPDEEIKILVVEIDGILHNVTWKGLD